MEYGVRPVFSDPVILKFLDERWLFHQSSGKVWREIPVGRLSISVSFDTTEFPALYISFRNEIDNFIGCFSYHLERCPISTELTPIFAESFFLETFDRKNSYLSRAAAIEKLMNYPEFKEWLLWNRP